MRLGVSRLLHVFGLSAALVLVACWLSSVPAGAQTLPDGRAYELVSPLDNGEVFQPLNALHGYESALLGTGQFRAAAGGDSMVYVGDPPGSGIGGNGNHASDNLFDNEYLASRAAGGWAAGDVEPPPAPEFESRPVYESFSSDLSVGYMTSPSHPVLAGAPTCRRGQDLYSRSSVSGAFAALFTSTLTPGECGAPLFAGASADGSHVVFQNEAALVAPAVPAAGSNSEFCYFDCNLYESVGGSTSLVNVLPGGGGVDTAATFGGQSGTGARGNEPDLSNVISADGSLVVWSDVGTGIIYVREGGVSTVQVSAGAARYWTSSRDGRYVFYTEGERLLRFDVESGAREELAGTGAGVQGVVGTSEDGTYVYFVADGVLAPHAAPGSCEPVYPGYAEEEAKGREEERTARCNLYVLHVGEPVRFLAMLAGSDDNLGRLAGGTPGVFGDWQSNLGTLTAEVAADGQSVAFSSTLPLTGYDNVAATDPQHRAIPELFVYEWEAGGGQLDCASCALDGTPPTEDVVVLEESEQEYKLGAWVHPSTWVTYTQRWLSDDGGRVFFDTAQPLVAQDTNGLTDVYEWERDGVGGCGQSGGCIYLLSGGSSTDDSFFLDASAGGDDVFFMSRAQLVPEDGEENFQVYDARAPHVPGEAVGFPPVAGASCGGADCQGPAPVAPGFGAPSSVMFGGVGNLSAPGPVVVKAKPKKAVVCRRGFARRHGKCVRVKAKAKPRAKHAKAKGRR